jgi:tellurite resistance protein TerC
MTWLLAAKPTLDVPILFWVGFMAVVVLMLVVDLVVFHRKPHEVKTREAVGWTIFWILAALAFNAWIWWEFDHKHAHVSGAAGEPPHAYWLDFLTAYIVEKSLSVDNLFVFLVVFEYFRVPPSLQHRVLFFGILGALVLRMAFVLAGAELLTRFHWTAYVFGGFLVFTAVKLLFQKEEEPDPSKNIILRLFKKVVPCVADNHGTKLTVVHEGKRCATLLLVVIVVVEATDVVFAVDSVPAVLAVTPDPFLAFTSNVAAILGLRAIYFLLAKFMGAFRYLKPGLAFVLGFVGFKMFGFVPISSAVSLAVIGGILLVATTASILHPVEKKDEAAPPIAP